MSDNLFEEKQTSSDSLIQDNPGKAALDRLVGPGKKFATIEDLALGKENADNHISTLNNKLANSVSLDEHLTKMNEAVAQARANVPAAPMQRHEVPVTNAPSEKSQALTEVQVAELVSKVLNQETTKAARAKNVDSVKQELQKVWGNDYINKLKAKATELGVGTDFLNDVAANSPKALMSLVGVNSNTQNNQSTNVTTPTSVNSTSQLSDNGKRDWAWYENLRKTNSKLYWDRKTQIQMEKDALEQREAFGFPKT